MYYAMYAELNRTLFKNTNKGKVHLKTSLASGHNPIEIYRAQVCRRSEASIVEWVGGLGGGEGKE